MQRVCRGLRGELFLLRGPSVSSEVVLGFFLRVSADDPETILLRDGRDMHTEMLREKIRQNLLLRE